MTTIKELLGSKGKGPIHTVTPEETVFVAVTRMVEMNVGAMIVTCEDSICGILTERDYLRFVTAQGRTARTTPSRAAIKRLRACWYSISSAR